MALLGLDTQGRDGPGFQPFEANGLGSFLAETVGPILDPLQRLIDLVDQLAGAVTGAQL